MKNSILNKYLLLKPSLRGYIEWVILLISGIIGLFFTWNRIPFSPAINYIGIILFIGGLLFHVIAERSHKQAHDEAKKITKIISTGVYAKIRHPLYLSLISMNIAIGLIFSSWITLGLAGLISILTVLTMYKEEQFLLSKLPEDYTAYIKMVKWRCIPGIF
jgi:protein-S-isoprenylcysteine O-methyltransferase Ste14